MTWTPRLRPGPSGADDRAPVREYVAPPRRSWVVPRERLVARLEAATGTPLVLVTAPAGFGKTTLLTEWAAVTETPVAWIDVGIGHADLMLLLGDLARGLGELDPALGADSRGCWNAAGSGSARSSCRVSDG